MQTLRAKLFAAALLAASMSLSAQEPVAAPATTAPPVDATAATPAAAALPSAPETTAPEEPQDTLLFQDGDLLKGEVARIEDGYAVFRNHKVGQIRVDFGQIKDMKCPRNFVIFKKGLRVRKKNAIIGRLELKDGSFYVTPVKGEPFSIPYFEVAFAVDDLTYEQEIAKKFNLHEGWTYDAFAGLSLVRATEHGTAVNAGGTLTRSLPGIDFLPRRSSSTINLTDTYEKVTTPAFYEGGEPTTAETHTFHAGAEHNEYLHSQFYALADWSFDRNYAQGLLAEQTYGGGIGWSVLTSYQYTLDIKSDFHHESQAFVDGTYNDTLVGQKFVVDYEMGLPKGFRFRESSDYLAAYNEPHRYSADGTFTLTAPMFWRFGLAFTVTDNYLNNPVAGYKRNTFRFATNLTFR